MVNTVTPELYSVSKYLRREDFRSRAEKKADLTGELVQQPRMGDGSRMGVAGTRIGWPGLDHREAPASHWAMLTHSAANDG